MTSSPTPAPPLSVLVPVRNEGANLRIMLKILRATVEVPHEVLVVYDDPDDTSQVVVDSLRETYVGLRGVLNQRGRGVINAIKAGVESSRGDYVLILAADEVGPLLAIENMLELAEAGCEFVSCTRYAHGGRRLGGAISGRVLSRAANWAFRYLAGCVMTDATTGIKMIRRDWFDQLELEARPVGWAVAFEMAIKAQAAGLRIGEVPIISIDRLYGGESTFKLSSWTLEYLRWFVWGVRRLRFSGVGRRQEVVVSERDIQV